MYGGKYRINQLNLCLRYCKFSSTILFSTWSYFIFKLILFFFNKKVVPIFLDGKENYVNYGQLKNLVRFELINLVNKYFNKNLFLACKDWANLGFNSKIIEHNTSFRTKIYMNNICLDFGSKSGVNSIYLRTIEILENYGFLLQSE